MTDLRTLLLNQDTQGAELFDSPKDPYTRRLIDAVPRLNTPA